MTSRCTICLNNGDGCECSSSVDRWSPSSHYDTDSDYCPSKRATLAIKKRRFGYDTRLNNSREIWCTSGSSDSESSSFTTAATPNRKNNKRLQDITRKKNCFAVVRRFRELFGNDSETEQLVEMHQSENMKRFHYTIKNKISELDALRMVIKRKEKQKKAKKMLDGALHRGTLSESNLRELKEQISEQIDPLEISDEDLSDSVDFVYSEYQKGAVSINSIEDFIKMTKMEHYKKRLLQQHENPVATSNPPQTNCKDDKIWNRPSTSRSETANFEGIPNTSVPPIEPSINNRTEGRHILPAIINKETYKNHPANGESVIKTLNGTLPRRRTIDHAEKCTNLDAVVKKLTTKTGPRRKTDRVVELHIPEIGNNMPFLKDPDTYNDQVVCKALHYSLNHPDKSKRVQDYLIKQAIRHIKIVAAKFTSLQRMSYISQIKLFIDMHMQSGGMAAQTQHHWKKSVHLVTEWLYYTLKHSEGSYTLHLDHVAEMLFKNFFVNYPNENKTLFIDAFFKRTLVHVHYEDVQTKLITMEHVLELSDENALNIVMNTRYHINDELDSTPYPPPLLPNPTNSGVFVPSEETIIEDAKPSLRPIRRKPLIPIIPKISRPSEVSNQQPSGQATVPREPAIEDQTPANRKPRILKKPPVPKPAPILKRTPTPRQQAILARAAIPPPVSVPITNSRQQPQTYIPPAPAPNEPLIADIPRSDEQVIKYTWNVNGPVIDEAPNPRNTITVSVPRKPSILVQVPITNELMIPTRNPVIYIQPKPDPVPRTPMVTRTFIVSTQTPPIVNISAPRPPPILIEIPLVKEVTPQQVAQSPEISNPTVSQQALIMEATRRILSPQNVPVSRYSEVSKPRLIIPKPASLSGQPERILLSPTNPPVSRPSEVFNQPTIFQPASVQREPINLASIPREDLILNFTTRPLEVSNQQPPILSRPPISRQASNEAPGKSSPTNPPVCRHPEIFNPQPPVVPREPIRQAPIPNEEHHLIPKVPIATRPSEIPNQQPLILSQPSTSRQGSNEPISREPIIPKHSPVTRPSEIRVISEATIPKKSPNLPSMQSPLFNQPSGSRQTSIPREPQIHINPTLFPQPEVSGQQASKFNLTPIPTEPKLQRSPPISSRPEIYPPNVPPIYNQASTSRPIFGEPPIPKERLSSYYPPVSGPSHLYPPPPDPRLMSHLGHPKPPFPPPPIPSYLDLARSSELYNQIQMRRRSSEFNPSPLIPMPQPVRRSIYDQPSTSTLPYPPYLNDYPALPPYHLNPMVYAEASAAEKISHLNCIYESLVANIPNPVEPPVEPPVEKKTRQYNRKKPKKKTAAELELERAMEMRMDLATRLKLSISQLTSEANPQERLQILKNVLKDNLKDDYDQVMQCLAQNERRVPEVFNDEVIVIEDDIVPEVPEAPAEVPEVPEAPEVPEVVPPPEEEVELSPQPQQCENIRKRILERRAATPEIVVAEDPEPLGEQPIPDMEVQDLSLKSNPAKKMKLTEPDENQNYVANPYEDPTPGCSYDYQSESDYNSEPSVVETPMESPQEVFQEAPQELSPEAPEEVPQEAPQEVSPRVNEIVSGLTVDNLNRVDPNQTLNQTFYLPAYYQQLDEEKLRNLRGAEYYTGKLIQPNIGRHQVLKTQVFTNKLEYHKKTSRPKLVLNKREQVLPGIEVELSQIRSRRQSLETVSSNSDTSFVPNEEIPRRKSPKMSINFTRDPVPKGKLSFDRENNMLVRYFDEAECERFQKNIKQNDDSKDIGGKEVIQLPKDVRLHTDEIIADPSDYIDEIDMVKKFVPQDFYLFYKYVSRYQIVRRHNPISFQTFLTMHNTNRLRDLHEKYVRSLRNNGEFD